MIVKETPVLPARSQIVLIAASTAVVAAAYGLVRLAYGLMLPDVQAELGLDTDTAGLISSGASIVFCVAALIGLFVASRNARMLVVFAAVTAGLGAIGMALAVLPTVPVLALVAFAVFGWGYLVCCGTLIVWTVQIDPARAPAGTSLLFIVLIFGQGVGAGVAGFIAVSAGYLAAFLVAAAVSFVAGLIVYVKRTEA
ncbi:MAG: MFS transporter [Leucobacter sp.]